MGAIKICPYCGSTQFLGIIKRGGIVESVGVKDNGTVTFNILKEGATDKYEIDIRSCYKCKEKLATNDLVEGVKCIGCGNIVPPSDICEDGLCSMCAFTTTDPEIQNASREDILRLLIDARRQLKLAGIQEKKEAKLAKAPDLEVDEDISTEEVQNNEVVQPKKRRARRKKDAVQEPQNDQEDAIEADNVEMPVASKEPVINAGMPSNDLFGEMGITTQQVEVATEKIADTQSAPFPDIEMPNIPSAPSLPDNNGFNMFDGEDNNF